MNKRRVTVKLHPAYEEAIAAAGPEMFGQVLLDTCGLVSISLNTLPDRKLLGGGTITNVTVQIPEVLEFVSVSSGLAKGHIIKHAIDRLIRK